jgi:hypothetical protein
VNRREIHVQLSVSYGENPKIRALARYGRDARACRDLYVQMVCYCKRNLTDGFVPDEEIGVLVYPDPPKVGLRDANRLVDVQLAERTGGGYLITGFLKRNKSRAQVEATSAAKAESGRQGGVRSGLVRRGEAEPKHPASANTNHFASFSEAKWNADASVCLNTEYIVHRTPPSPPGGTSAGRPPAEAPGEGDQDRRQARIAALVADLRAIRPDWATASIERALGHPAVLDRPWPLVAAAAVDVARRPDTEQPGRLAQDGPWWRQLAVARRARPPWCGTCDERTRMRGLDGETPARCPACHPMTRKAAS